MTPEQLEAIEGIGPKTVEKISLAVNNYFSGLEGAEVAPAEGESASDEVVAEAAEEATTEQEALADEQTEAAAEPNEELAPESPATGEESNEESEQQ
jgi:N utilization substance protein A